MRERCFAMRSSIDLGLVRVLSPKCLRAKARHNHSEDHQELTDKIIVALEAGTAQWRRPLDKTAWRRHGAKSTPPPAIATCESIISSSECRRSLSRPTTHAGGLTARPARAVGRSARARAKQDVEKRREVKRKQCTEKEQKQPMGVPAHAVRSLGHLAALSQLIHVATADRRRFSPSA